MPLDPPQAYRKTRFTHRRDTRANQPLATDVLNGTLYYVTDETVLERSNGTIWQSFSASVVTPGITQLTGDVTAIGPGSAVATLANTAATPGTFGSATKSAVITVDSKGRITASSEVTITDTGITQLTGDVTAGPGSGSQAATLSNTGVAAGSYGSTTSVGTFTVDAKGRLTAAANAAIAFPTYTQGSVLFAGVTGAPTQDNTNFFFNDTTDQLKVTGSILSPLIIGGTGTTDDLTLQATSGVGTTGSWIFFKVGNNGAVTAMEINDTGKVGIGTTGIVSLTSALHVRQANPPDIGIVADFRSNLTCYIQMRSGTGANEQAGFSLVQATNSKEWRVAVIGNDGDAFRIAGGAGGTDVKAYVTQNGNIHINDTRVEPSTGTKTLIFGDGTVPSSLTSNTAGLYANDVGGTVQMFGINEAGESTQLTGVPVFSTSSTGTVNDLATGTVDIVYCDNASDLTLTGMDAGVDGQRRIIVSRGAGHVFLSHQTGSAAAKQFFNSITTGPTPLATTKGSAVYEYDASITKWRLINHTMGGFISSSFSAGEFTGNNAMTWTVASGDVTFDRYTIINRVMFWQFRYLTTTVGGTPDTTLQKTYPGGYTGNGFDEVDYGVDNGTAMITWISNNAGNTGVNFFKQAGGNWAAATDTTAIRGNLAIGLA